MGSFADNGAGGYTLTIWSAGALCVRRFGLPDFPQVLLFVIGGTVGFGAVPALSRTRGGVEEETRPGQVVNPWPLRENVAVLPALFVTVGLSQVLPTGADLSFFLVPLCAPMCHGLLPPWSCRTGISPVQVSP